MLRGYTTLVMAPSVAADWCSALFYCRLSQGAAAPRPLRVSPFGGHPPSASNRQWHYYCWLLRRATLRRSSVSPSRGSSCQQLRASRIESARLSSPSVRCRLPSSPSRRSSPGPHTVSGLRSIFWLGCVPLLSVCVLGMCLGVVLPQRGIGSLLMRRLTYVVAPLALTAFVWTLAEIAEIAPRGSMICFVW